MTITPRTLKGFRDFLPAAMIPRERLIETARNVYRSYGFVPIDTPALEYEEILLGKGSEETDRQIYRFADQGGRRVAMRFDLTVPLARFVAQHIQQLGKPFKRYHIGPVWRGENTHRGRYREFYQCDFDTIGTQSIAADIEIVLVIHDLLRAIGVERFTIRINNRKVLNGLLSKLGLASASVPVLRALDKLTKTDRDRVAQEMMSAAGASAQQADQVLALADLNGDRDSVVSSLQEIVHGSEVGQQGVAELQQVLAGSLAAGVDSEHLQLDVSIARGLDYYTGTIVETFLDSLPEIGSICSGGRYDNLAELYTKEHLPGIGASLGLDRLLAALQELKLIDTVATTAAVFIPYFDASELNSYLKIASWVRQAGYGVEVYPEPKKLGQQLSYAADRGFQIALIAGRQELDNGKCQIKNLKTRHSLEVATGPNGAGIVQTVREILARD
ncbi:MAG: histidine--tRNA ligase [Pirellulaceae bacterium]|nr:histidine--tRNA ligase [Planctomycetales bacterium]